MKILIIALALSFLTMANDSLRVKSQNIGSDIEISVVDGDKSILKFTLLEMLREGINLKHRKVNYEGQRYVLNIFANQEIIEKTDLNNTNVEAQCKHYKTYKKLFDIKSEVSFSISLGFIDNAYLRQIDVVENKDIIKYKKRYTYRCR
jgi:hypothetical protein